MPGRKRPLVQIRNPGAGEGRAPVVFSLTLERRCPGGRVRFCCRAEGFPGAHAHRPLSFGFPSRSGHHRALRRGPRAGQQALTRPQLDARCQQRTYGGASLPVLPHAFQLQLLEWWLSDSEAP